MSAIDITTGCVHNIYYFLLWFIVHTLSMSSFTVNLIVCSRVGTPTGSIVTTANYVDVSQVRHLSGSVI